MKKYSNRKNITLLLAFCFLLGGVYFTTTNSYTLLKGYALYKWNKTELPVTTTEVKKEAIQMSPLYPTRPNTGDMIGDLYIPKLDSSLPILSWNR